MNDFGAGAGNPRRNIHSHAWLVGAAGLLVGLILMVYVPSLHAVSSSILLFAGFHIVGALIILASAYSLGLRTMIRRWAGGADARSQDANYDFGWGPEWMNGLAVISLGSFAGAVAVAVAAPAFWPIAFALVLLAAAFLGGNVIMRSFRSHDHIVLPMVQLLRSDNDLVLDAGCGSGRTTIALGRVLGGGRVIAVDRFDSDYIDDGGRPHIDHNLRLAGLSDRVTIVKADLTALPFEDAHFDAAVSTNVFDHLGEGKRQALNEVRRVLKPGGRFLMAVWVPSWPMFAVANVLSFFLTNRRAWREMAARAGLRVIDEGVFNFSWFVLLENTEGPGRAAR